MPGTDREVADLLTPPYLPGFSGAPPPPTAYLEDLVKYAGIKMPGSYMAVYAGNWGFIKGILTARNFRIVLVKPQEWQKALGLGTRGKGQSKTQWKNKLKQRAEQLFPTIKVTLANADALLIFEAAKRGLLG